MVKEDKLDNCDERNNKITGKLKSTPKNGKTKAGNYHRRKIKATIAQMIPILVRLST